MELPQSWKQHRGQTHWEVWGAEHPLDNYAICFCFSEALKKIFGSGKHKHGHLEAWGKRKSFTTPAKRLARMWSTGSSTAAFLPAGQQCSHLPFPLPYAYTHSSETVVTVLMLLLWFHLCHYCISHISQDQLQPQSPRTEPPFCFSPRVNSPTAKENQTVASLQCWVCASCLSWASKAKSEVQWHQSHSQATVASRHLPRLGN